MHFIRPDFAPHLRRFGKRQVCALAVPSEPAWVMSDDLKLFAATFLAGFLFVSILIG